MTLSIAVSNKSEKFSHPSVTRQHRARTRFLSRIASIHPIGSTVYINGTEGMVLGYNISDFGRWLGVSHPVLVKLKNDQVFFCRLSDLSDNPKQPAFF